MNICRVQTRGGNSFLYFNELLPLDHKYKPRTHTGMGNHNWFSFSFIMEISLYSFPFTWQNMNIFANFNTAGIMTGKTIHLFTYDILTM